MADDPVDTDDAPAESDKGEATDDAPTITLPDGSTLTAADIVELKKAGLRQADYTKKTQALSEERKAMEERLRAELRAEWEANHAFAPEEASPLDEYVPGLSKELAKLQQSINQLTEAQKTTQAEARKILEESEIEEAWDKTLADVGKKPYADKDEIRNFLESRGWGPEHADVAYAALYGHKLGAEAKEKAMRARGADKPAPMKPGGLGLPQATAQDAALANTPIEKQSWQQRRDMALRDPRRPRIAT